MSGMVHKFNPLTDPRWPRFLESHPGATVFHSPQWLSVLQKTYGYEPVVYTTSPPEQPLDNGVALCYVRSKLTGNRAVSVPFSDQCQPLVDNEEDLRDILSRLADEKAELGWKYVEIRPFVTDASFQQRSGFGISDEYYYHRLDLKPDIDTLFAGLSKKSIRGMIRRAEKENYEYKAGREDLVADFYRLQTLTRKKHGVPPQPLSFFKNLLHAFGEDIDIHLTYTNGRPIAAIFTIFYKDTVFWKWGCSDSRLDRFGTTRVLLWNSICNAKERGATTFDMGRSDMANQGLIQFKDRFGTTRSSIHYYRVPIQEAPHAPGEKKFTLARKVFATLPNPLLALCGRLIYRHIG